MPARTVTISRAGHLVGATSEREAIRALAQSIMKIDVTSKIPGVTDNSGGAVGVAPLVLTLPSLLANTPVSGSNVAAVADVNAGLTALRSALRTLFAKANAIASAAGFAPVTYGGGGTDGAGTVAAIPDTVAGAATGPDFAASNVLLNGYNNAVYNLAALVNRLTEATGDDNVRLNPTNAPVVNTQNIGALGVDVGAAQGVSAVSAADWANALSLWQNAIAIVANRLNAVVAPGTVRLIAVR